MGLFDLGGAFKPREVCGIKNSRYIAPRFDGELDPLCVKYSHAEQLAQGLGEIGTGFRAFVFLSGRFIFGDAIEALCVHHNWDVVDLTISTLSMSKNNIDSLANLLRGDYVRELNLLVSDHFYSHERHDLVKCIYETLDAPEMGSRLQLGVASVHTKITTIKTACGKNIVMHGSANLRTSDNIEQVMIEESKVLYDFVDATHKAIINRYKTINKSVRSGALTEVLNSIPDVIPQKFGG